MKRYLKILPVILALAFILLLSFQAPDASIMETSWFVKDLAKINSAINHREVNTWLTYVLIRKFAHTVEYIFLGISLAIFFGDSRHYILFPMLLSACSSVLDQLIKICIPGREFDITDLPFDVMGYVIGTLIVAVIRKQK